MEYYLNGTRIKEPGGMSGFYLEKQYSDFFEGFVRRSVGQARAQGIGNVTYDEQIAVWLLDAIYALDSIDGEVIFEMKKNGEPIFSANVDFAVYTSEKNERNAGIIDNLGDLLEIRANDEISLTPSAKITIPTTPLASKINWKIDADGSFALVEKRNQSRIVDHNIPLKLQSGDVLANGALFSTTADGSGLLYTNTTGQTLSIEFACLLNFEAMTGDTITTQLLLIVADSKGKETSRLVIGSFSINSSIDPYTASLQRTIPLLTGYSISLRMVSTSTTTSQSFRYLDTSYISLTDDVIPDTHAWCISAMDAVSELLANIDSALILTDSAKAELAKTKLYFTNGYNLRGQKKPIKLSLSALFNDLKVLKNLSLDLLYTNRVEISTNNPKAGAPTLVEDIERIVYQPDIDRLYKSITIGYSSFESGSASGNLERNSSITLSTIRKRGRTELELKCNAIGSSRAIEAARRIQFDEQKNSSSDVSTDSKLFVIECENAKAIVVQQQLNYNLSPFLLLELHYEKWAHLQPLTLTASGSPFYFDRIGEKITTTKTPQYSGNIVVIGANTSTRDFSEIGKTVIFFEGTQEKRAKVILATHRPFKRESGNNTVITGRVLL